MLLKPEEAHCVLQLRGKTREVILIRTSGGTVLMHFAMEESGSQAAPEERCASGQAQGTIE